MISGVAALPLLPVVQEPNLHGEIVTQVVPASTEPVGFIPEDATHVSSCLPFVVLMSLGLLFVDCSICRFLKIWPHTGTNVLRA